MLSRLGGKSSTFSNSTMPKMKVYAPAIDFDYVYEEAPVNINGEFVPVYVALGMIGMSLTLGFFTAIHQLARAPNVFVRKSKRESVPELVDPDTVVDEADKFIKKSFFRKVAHIQHAHDPTILHNDPIRGDVLARPSRAETLKTVGVDPKIH